MFMQLTIVRPALFAVAAGAALAVSFSAPALAGGVPPVEVVNTGYFGNVAIEGYDAVAYFTDHKATKGSEKYSYEWLGASWQFASDEHRQLFEADPISYAPQFGGLCAEGMAYDEMTVNIEPEAWQIIDGKLYITAGAHFGEDMGKIRTQAEAKWPAVAAELSQ
jgi:YHS domain-containing protein